MFAPTPTLTLADFEWLRKVRAATDGSQPPPFVPVQFADKLREFGFVVSRDFGGLAITDQIVDAELCWSKI